MHVNTFRAWASIARPLGWPSRAWPAHEGRFRLPARAGVGSGPASPAREDGHRPTMHVGALRAWAGFARSRGRSWASPVREGWHRPPARIAKARSKQLLVRQPRRDGGSYICGITWRKPDTYGGNNLHYRMRIGWIRLSPCSESARLAWQVDVPHEVPKLIDRGVRKTSRGEIRNMDRAQHQLRRACCARRTRTLAHMPRTCLYAPLADAAGCPRSKTSVAKHLAHVAVEGGLGIRTVYGNTSRRLWSMLASPPPSRSASRASWVTSASFPVINTGAEPS